LRASVSLRKIQRHGAQPRRPDVSLTAREAVGAVIESNVTPAVMVELA
jgi:hypothetical protein